MVSVRSIKAMASGAFGLLTPVKIGTAASNANVAEGLDAVVRCLVNEYPLWGRQLDLAYLISVTLDYA